MAATATRMASGDIDALPEAMSSITVAKLAHQVAVKVIQESDEMQRETLDLLA